VQDRRLHLAHTLSVKAFTYRRTKNDARDAADLLRMGLLPEAWIAPRTVPALFGERCPSSLPADLAAVVGRGRAVDRLDDLQEHDLGGGTGQPEPAARTPPLTSAWSCSAR